MRCVLVVVEEEEEELGPGLLLSKGDDSSLRAKGLIEGEVAIHAEEEVVVIAITLGSESNVDTVAAAAESVTQLSEVEVVVVESNSWVRMSSCIASLAMACPAVVGEDGV